MGGTAQITVALVLIALFSVAIIGFAIGFANDNNAAIDISDDPDVVGISNNAQGNLSDFRAGSEDTYSSIVNSSISQGSFTTGTGGQFAITPAAALGTLYNILNVAYTKMFGSPFAIFFTTFGALIVILIGLWLWKTWRSGLPD